MVVVKHSSVFNKPYLTQIMQRLRPALIVVAALTIGAVYSGTHVQHAHAIFQFTEVSAEAGIEPYVIPLGMGAGVALADFDDDGDIDIFVPNNLDVPDQLYINLGDGTFAESAAQWGLASLNSHRVALWFDYDGDHRLDLVVAGDCYGITVADDPLCEGSLTLYRQTAEQTFVDVTPSAGELSYTGRGHLGGISAGDINNDGYLDLYIPVWSAITDAKFFLNNGDGTFTDISESSGAVVSGEREWQAVFHDFNGDGWADMFVAVDFSDNRLWLNQGDNTFLDVAPEAGVNKGPNEMGIAISDYDNDQDMDLYVTNTPFSTVLHRNETLGAIPTFSDATVEAGVGDVSWTWGCTFLDANNDGLLDLAVTNGYLFSSTSMDASVFFLSNGGNPATFSTVSDEVGFNDTFWGASLLALDFDRDGNLDLIQSTRHQNQLERVPQVRLLRNTPDPEDPTNHYLVVKPRQNGPNHWGIGAVVRVQIGATVMSRLITAGTSFMGQEPAEAHFGLGAADQVDSVTIEWPDGEVTVVENLQADVIYTIGGGIIAPGPYDFDGDGLTDEVEMSVHATDPYSWDTDGDGVGDGNEVTFGSNPLDAGDTAELGAANSLAAGLTVLLLLIVGLASYRRVWRHSEWQ